MIQVTAAIIKKGAKVLIARRGPKKHLAGYWEFPGGKVEFGESPSECLKRELLEELGIEVKVGDFFMQNEHTYGDKKINLQTFFCEYLNGDIVLLDHDSIIWIDIFEFMNYKFAPADIPIVKALIET